MRLHRGAIDKALHGLKVYEKTTASWENWPPTNEAAADSKSSTPLVDNSTATVSDVLEHLGSRLQTLRLGKLMPVSLPWSVSLLSITSVTNYMAHGRSTAWCRAKTARQSDLSIRLPILESLWLPVVQLLRQDCRHVCDSEVLRRVSAHPTR